MFLISHGTDGFCFLLSNHREPSKVWEEATPRRCGQGSVQVCSGSSQQGPEVGVGWGHEATRQVHWLVPTFRGRERLEKRRGHGHTGRAHRSLGVSPGQHGQVSDAGTGRGGVEQRQPWSHCHFLGFILAGSFWARISLEGVDGTPDFTAHRNEPFRATNS